MGKRVPSTQKAVVLLVVGNRFANKIKERKKIATMGVTRSGLVIKCLVDAFLVYSLAYLRSVSAASEKAVARVVSKKGDFCCLEIKGPSLLTMLTANTQEQKCHH